MSATEALPDRGCPYPGLRPFRMDEDDVFFGRNTQIDEILLRLKTHQFLGVVGSSGCGKSSVIRAGVLPALRDALPKLRLALREDLTASLLDEVRAGTLDAALRDGVVMHIIDYKNGRLAVRVKEGDGYNKDERDHSPPRKPSKLTIDTKEHEK